MNHDGEEKHNLLTWLHSHKLKSSDPGVRRAAVERLAAEGPKMVSRLLPMLADEDADVRGAAVRALGNGLSRVSQDAREQIVSALRPLLGDADGGVQITAALTLAVEVDDGRARNLLLECAHAATAAAEGVLSGATADVSRGVRLEAIRGLGRLKDPATRAVLLAILRDHDAEVRGAACEALGVAGDARTIDVLRRIQLSDADPTVKEKAKCAILDIREQRGLPELAAGDQPPPS